MSDEDILGGVLPVPEPGESGTWTVELAERWNVGRYQNGGVVLAAAAAALERSTGQPHPLTVTGHYLRPTVAGQVLVQVEVVRQGRTAATGVAGVWQGERECVRVVGTFADLAARGASRDVSQVAEMHVSAPVIPGPEKCNDLFDVLAAAPVGGRALTRSLRNYQIRVDPARGWGLDGAGRPALSGWIRITGEDTIRPEMAVVVADGFPPTLLSQLTIGWLPTLELTVHVLAVPVPDEPWLRAEVRTASVAGGLVDEDGELWDASGRLICRFRQLAQLLLPGPGA